MSLFYFYFGTYFIEFFSMNCFGPMGNHMITRPSFVSIPLVHFCRHSFSVFLDDDGRC